MKKIMKLIMVFCVSSFVMSSCDLELQDNFEFETSAVSNNEPFDNITALQFITEQSSTPSDETEGFDGEKFDYMLAAINKAGMRNEYSSATKNRTYLLLNNNAFTGNNDVIQRATGSASTRVDVLDELGEPVLNEAGEEMTRLLSPEEVFDRVDTPEKLQTLRDILNYQIVDDLVSQRTLTSTNKFFVFQTLVPGPEGLIVFHRDFELAMRINSSFRVGTTTFQPPSITDVARRNAEPVRSHNFVFNNGVGHVINDHVRFK